MKTLFLFFALFVTQAHAQNGQVNSYNQMTNSASAYRGPDLKNTWVSGICEFDAGSCNGAEVALYEDEEKIYSSTLTSRGEFQTPALKRNRAYKVVLTWPKYGIVEKRNVVAGEFVTLRVAMPSK